MMLLPPVRPILFFKKREEAQDIVLSFKIMIIDIALGASLGSQNAISTLNGEAR